MTPLNRSRRSVIAVLAVVVVVLTAVIVVRSMDPDASFPANGASAPDPSSTVGALTAEQAGRSFLDGYVDPDGRVVRRDQDGDTVSEGQAYAMLVAAALDDRATFNSIWSWTQQHLFRPDQTLSWLWRDGSVVDASSASDADLDAARALVIAGRAFGDPALTTAGIRLGQAVLDVETVDTPLGRIMVAGNWASTDPYAYNPSYASPVAFEVLHEESGDPRWLELADGSRRTTELFLDVGPLPPDWGQVDRQGQVQPTAGAAGRGSEGVRYGYDAARLPLRYAESCAPADVALAARLRAPLERAPRHAAVRRLDGEAIGTDESVVAVAGLAAAYAAAGDQPTSSAELSAADQLQRAHPTYYGAAWNALARVMLTEPTLGGCPPST